MSNLFLTLVIAFVVIILAIALLAIGWLLTGKVKIEKGCGRDPTKKRDDSCQTCDICHDDTKTSSTSLEDKDHPPSNS